MGNSLFDQLKKVGLVDDKKAKQVKTEKYKDRKQHQGKNAAASEDAKRSAQQAQAEEAERTRALNRKRQEDAERKAIAAQIKQIIETHRITEREGDTAYNFTHGTKIKRIYVSDDIHKQLTRGDLAIATLNGRYELVPKSVAEKIKQRDERRIVGGIDQPVKKSTDDNDPYAAYQVPDDLMW